MFRTAIILVSVLAAVCGERRSPNAAQVEDLIKTPDGSRFSSSAIEDALLDVPGLINKYGYPLEIHNVVTSDGYVLEAHRIPHGRDNNNQPGKRPAVFLMHGLLSSSADYLILGPGNALAYLLAEEGYDVWMGNTRGNYYSRNHVTMDPDDKNSDFWKFSWEQIGHYDIAAYVDRILEVTGESKVHYVGHSQGGTVFFVLNSLRPEFNDKIAASFHGLGPAAYFVNNENPMFLALAPYEKILETIVFQLRSGELLPNSPILTWVGITGCPDQSPFQTLCLFALNNNGKFDTFNKTMTPAFFGHAPAGSSIRQVSHYAQSINRKGFARFNFNPLTNLIKYGRVNPPEFDLSQITVPSYLYYGISDVEVDWRDVHLLAEKLANTIEMNRMDRDSFNHFDFIWGGNVKEELYDKLIVNLKTADN